MCERCTPNRVRSYGRVARERSLCRVVGLMQRVTGAPAYVPGPPDLGTSAVVPLAVASAPGFQRRPIADGVGIEEVRVIEDGLDEALAVALDERPQLLLRASLDPSYPNKVMHVSNPPSRTCGNGTAMRQKTGAFGAGSS